MGELAFNLLLFEICTTANSSMSLVAAWVRSHVALMRDRSALRQAHRKYRIQ